MHFTTTDLDPDSLRGQNVYFKGCVASFSLTPDETIQDALCLEDGITQLKRSAVTQAVWTLSVTYQFINWQTLQIVYNELAQTVSNIVLPKVKTAVVDINGEVADSAIVAGNIDSVKASVVENGQPAFLIKSASPPANAGEFQATAGLLIFDASLAGATVSYVYDATYSSIEAIGVADDYDKFGKLQFSGILGGTEFDEGIQLVCPELNRTTTPELNISEGLVELQVEYKLGLPAGERLPFKMYNLDTGVEV